MSTAHETTATSASSTPASGDGLLQWLREGVTALIALTITAVSLWMLCAAFTSASATAGTDKDAAAAKADAFNRQKDVLLYGLALLGTVTGYYLGRVPAELRAQAAQQQRDQAKQQEANTKAEVKEGLKNIAAQLRLPAAPAVATAEALGAVNLDRVRADVNSLLERVG